MARLSRLVRLLNSIALQLADKPEKTRSLQAFVDKWEAVYGKPINDSPNRQVDAETGEVKLFKSP